MRRKRNKQKKKGKETDKQEKGSKKNEERDGKEMKTVERREKRVYQITVFLKAVRLYHTPSKGQQKEQKKSAFYRTQRIGREERGCKERKER